ncbi:MAG: uracil phosphoribosyltransferase [Firmicutes bacterium]|nr:uracil phosphoribosyltransferase [Bacillota bacterium]
MHELQCVPHPVARAKLSRLRDRATDVLTFRRLVYELAIFLAVECTRDLPVDEYTVQTPLTATVGHRLATTPVLMPVLRAGLGMVEGMLQVIPEAEIGHIGMYRDHDSLTPVEYYVNTPAHLPGRRVIVLDPMLATGGSACAALAKIKQRGADDISLAAIIAAPEGVARLREEHPDVALYAIAVDERLNEHGYIVPGLGDAGDRIFGTL